MPAMQFDHGNAGMRAAGTVAPPADLDDGFSTLSVDRFKTRVLDRQFRDATDAFTTMFTRCRYSVRRRTRLDR